MGTTASKSMRNVFGETLTELTQQDARTVALDGDLGNSTRLAFVEKENPSAFLQMGIAEQNMVGVAAGLASCGQIPWVCSFGAFISRRAYDQIVVSVDQPSLNVKLVGSYSGLLTSNTGKTHHSFEDIAMMTLLPNMVVLSPGDALEARQAMEAMQRYDGPVYLRLSRDETLDILPGSDRKFAIGKSYQLASGQNVACLSTGAMTPRVYEAVQNLQEEGVHVTHLHFPTIKPLDEQAIVAAARQHDHLITIEEHFVAHGFGGMVSRVTSRDEPVRMTRIGIEDAYSQCGKDPELLDEHGLSSDALTERLRTIYEQVSSS
ncbi:transketolase family protein [Thalassobacillus sp. CUG 92003]|uniref:transketolase family protein n=1 Tax=Thalassobacillus sp. CUG 92003 TaxID=2736641 RepID=UPI0015E635B7|nr:transketolase C-terminal domain-containing protein [Thalassobacillus sp. CUG 92003]